MEHTGTEPIKMQVQEDCSINWSWFKVRNGDLVALFRLHVDSFQLSEFYELMKDMVLTDIEMEYDMDGRFAGEIANHYNLIDGYSRRDVIEAFGWLAKMFRDTTSPSLSDTDMDCVPHWLEYHGVTIYEV